MTKSTSSLATLMDKSTRDKSWGIRHPALALPLFIVLVVAAMVLSKIASGPLVPAAPSPYHQGALLLANLFSAAMVIGAYTLGVRWIERRAAVELGLRRGVPLFAAGGIAGIALMGAVYLILQWLGVAAFAPGQGYDGILAELCAFFAAAVLEEVLIRGVVLRIAERWLGTAAALAISTALFALLHGLNPGATPLGVLAIAVEGGMFLSLAYVLSRNLWFVIAIHLAWDFSEGSLFGAQVSGIRAAHSLLRTTLTGSDVLTGGAFGPEASVVAIALFAAASILLGVIALRRGDWRTRATLLRAR